MRLIDADEVKETIRHRTKLAEWQKGIIWALIDTHKTVDAVRLSGVRTASIGGKQKSNVATHICYHSSEQASFAVVQRGKKNDRLQQILHSRYKQLCTT